MYNVSFETHTYCTHDSLVGDYLATICGTSTKLTYFLMVLILLEQKYMQSHLQLILFTERGKEFHRFL